MGDDLEGLQDILFFSWVLVIVETIVRIFDWLIHRGNNPGHNNEPNGDPAPAA